MFRRYSRPFKKISQEGPKEPRPAISPIAQLMNILSRRDHSEKEVRQKMKDTFSPEDIEKAITYGKERGWLPNSPESLLALSEKVADSLRRRGKGPQYINQYLHKKGLPGVERKEQEELEKALELVENKFFNGRSKKPADRGKVGRFLLARGFSSDTVRKVVYGSIFKFDM